MRALEYVLLLIQFFLLFLLHSYLVGDKVLAWVILPT